MKDKIFEIIELFIDPENVQHGVDAVSYVHDPAIETDFVHFHKEFNSNFSKIDEEKRLVVGPALIPNKMILRETNGNYFYVYFSESTVRKTSQLYLKGGHQNTTTYEHVIPLKGISVVESWIIEDKVHDKSVKFGFDLPIGTWMLTSYIENDDVWESIKAGAVKGYSIEGKYTDILVKNSEVELIGSEEEKNQYYKIQDIISKI